MVDFVILTAVIMQSSIFWDIYGVISQELYLLEYKRRDISRSLSSGIYMASYPRSSVFWDVCGVTFQELSPLGYKRRDIPGALSSET
jgi:hypothetical protein